MSRGGGNGVEVRRFDALTEPVDRPRPTPVEDLALAFQATFRLHDPGTIFGFRPSQQLLHTKRLLVDLFHLTLNRLQGKQRFPVLRDLAWPSTHLVSPYSLCSV